MSLKCGFVVDSTFDMPFEFYEKNNIKVAYLRSIFGENEVYKEHLELSPAEFYQKLKQAKKLPTTSQPPVGEFLEIYSEMLEKYDFIVSLHLPETLSGTMNSARTAAGELEGEIYIKSTMSVSVGSSLILEEILKLKENESDKHSFLAKVDKIISNQLLIGMLPTLDYLEKGGRIGKAQALLGSMLDFKPLLSVQDGVVTPLGRARGIKKAFKELYEHILNFASNSKISLRFGYGESPELTEEFKEFLISSGLEFEDRGTYQVGPVIGTYLGPEVVMVSVLKHE